ncbi:type VI secretion system TssO [Prevotella fusca]
MTEKNRKERQQAMNSFAFIFGFTMLLFVLFAVCTLKTAERGISLLDEKKARYDEVFRKQAGYNYRMDQMFKDMNNLTIQTRTDNEQARYHMIIARHIQEMQDEIYRGDVDTTHYVLYKVLFNQLQATQETTATYFDEKRDLDYIMEQIEKAQNLINR